MSTRELRAAEVFGQVACRSFITSAFQLSHRPPVSSTPLFSFAYEAVRSNLPFLNYKY